MRGGGGGVRSGRAVEEEEVGSGRRYVQMLIII